MGRAGRRLEGPSGATTLPLPVILSDGHTGALHLATPRGDLGWGRRPRAVLAAVASDLAPTVRAVAAATRLWRDPVEASTRAVPALPPFPLVLRSREGWGCWMAASRGRARLRTGRAGRQHGISRRGEAPTTAGTCWPDDKRSLGAVRSALRVPRPGAMSRFCSRAPSRPLPHVILSPTISRIRCSPNRLALRSQHCRTTPDFPRAAAQDDMSCPLLPLTSHLLPLPLSSSATSPLDFRAASTILKTEVRKCPELESASIRAKNQR